MVIAVTGTTGKLGGRVARLLAAEGHRQLLVGRDPDRLPELPGAERRGPAAYDDRAAMRTAVRGADTLFLVSASLSGRRLEEHTTAVEAAVDAGVERVVYVSLLGAGEQATYLNARDHGQTERYLADRGVRHTILRAGYYSSMLLSVLPDRDGVIRGPARHGRVALVSHDDIAEVAAAVLLDGSGRHDGEVLEVTGPEALTLADAAAQAEEATGRPCTFEPRGREETVDRWRRAVGDEAKAQAWGSWFESVESGEVATVTDVVPRLTGHPALTVAESLRRLS
jgi:NAD(P)H dehydrogenase (quinone)